MLDTSNVTATIKHLISTGTTEEQIVGALVQAYPELTLAELSEALQEATEAAERHVATRRH